MLVVFDIEISNTNIPDSFSGDLFQFSPLEYAVGGLIAGAGPFEAYEDPKELLARLYELSLDGGRIVTWNGSGFDFRILADSTGDLITCSNLCWDHYDLMFQVLCMQGYPLGLDKVSKGYGLEGKLKEVKLNDGSTADMSGKLAPKMWQDGERKAVIEYLRGDVEQTMAVAEKFESSKVVTWTSNKGRFMKVNVGKMQTVERANMRPLPNTSWMTDPMRRSKFTSWML